MRGVQLSPERRLRRSSNLTKGTDDRCFVRSDQFGGNLLGQRDADVRVWEGAMNRGGRGEELTNSGSMASGLPVRTVET